MYAESDGVKRPVATTGMSRAYRLGRREEAARQTRQKILQATADLLTEAGIRGVTIEAVARKAAVSRVTVYDHFQHKAGLLEALAWWTFEQHDIDRIRRARLQENVRIALVDFVQENARFFHSVGPQGHAILKTASTDPDAATVIEATYINARRAAIRELVDRLDDAHELTPRWSPERAVDALMVITSLEAFETLTAHGRLGLDETAEVLADMASVLLRNR
jgi:AcrR family transcriptional regulator